MKTKNVTYNWHDAETSVLEGVIARGDRRQGKGDSAGVAALQMDGWDQCFDFDKWMQAFRDCGSRSRVLRIPSASDGRECSRGITSAAARAKEHLKHEWERSREAAITPDCMHHVPAAAQALC